MEGDVTPGVVKVVYGATKKPEEDVNVDDGENTFSISNPTPQQLNDLKEKLKWQLVEGHGELIYSVGKEPSSTSNSSPSDPNNPIGMTDELLEATINHLRNVAGQISCEVSLICERKGKEGKFAEVLVREKREDNYIDIRYAVCGNVDSGKSTLIGVLTSGKLDDGRGLVRVNVFTHKHEQESGRTSAISQQIVGFDVKGDCVNYAATHGLSWGDIIEKSYKIISFLDLAGHERYLKTTVSGMTGQMPDYSLLLVGANMGVTRMTKEHLWLSLALKIPIVVLVTKIDLAPANILKETLSDIQKLMRVKGVRKIGLVIKDNDDLMTAVRSIASNDRLVPIFLLSNVTGENLDLVKKFLNLVPPRIKWDSLRDKPTEVLIDQTFFVTGVGTVVGGTVMAGSVVPNQNLLLGPDGNGQFTPVQIKSVHSKKVPVKQVLAGQSTGLAIRKIKRSMIRRGMVLVDPSLSPKATLDFEADVIILYHSTTIQANYQPVVQCMAIRQCAKIVKIVGTDLLRTGDRATVRFQFLYRPEYIQVGMRIIFREGRCKGIGIISSIIHPPAQIQTQPKKS